MSFPDAAGPQDVGPERLKPALGTPILGRSVEAKLVSDLCASAGTAAGVRARILTWLSEGAREVTWALCSVGRERWAAVPPERVGQWPALRHARYLALRESCVTLPTVRRALGAADAEAVTPRAAFDQVEAAWDAEAAVESAEDIVRGLGETRFDLLQTLETAPDEVWQCPLPSPLASAVASGQPAQLGSVLLQARHAELEHLAAIWRVALYWDRVSPASVCARVGDEQTAGFPLHPADRLEESH